LENSFKNYIFAEIKLLNIHFKTFLIMKMKHLSVAALFLATTLITTSCVGSFSLFNKLASWNTQATGSKILNELIFIVISPAYAVCSVADVLVLNTIEFWTGDNPVASNVGKTQQVKGEDGRFYAVKTLSDGYEITVPEGDVLTFIYDKETDSWSKIQDGKTTEILRFNEDGTVKVSLPSGEQMDVALNESGVNEVREAVMAEGFWAMR